MTEQSIVGRDVWVVVWVYGDAYYSVEVDAVFDSKEKAETYISEQHAPGQYRAEMMTID